MPDRFGDCRSDDGIIARHLGRRSEVLNLQLSDPTVYICLGIILL
jgi:hypothetical protein